ncbi:acyltransferase family protein [Cetobacterium somerae]
MKKYYREFTMLKGIGILLVLLGHSFSFTGFDLMENNKINLYIFKTIYSFHMPLFFLIAGFFANNYKNNLNKKFYLTKIKRLLIPYVFINIIDAIPRYFFPNLVNNKSNSIERIIFYSGAASWFVYSLFLLFLLFPIIETYIIKKDKYYFLGIVLFVLNLSGVANKITLFTLNQLVYMSFYFYMGYILKENYEKKWDIFYKRWSVLIVVIFFMIGYKYDGITLTKILYPFLGIITTFLIAIKLKESEKKIIEFICFCGENSLALYLLEPFYATIYRVILVKVIPIEYNFLLVGTFFFLKLVSLYVVVKYIVNKNFILSSLVGSKYDKKVVSNDILILE